MTDSLEIPAGKLDVPGEPPLACAKRELVEEIGMQAASWSELTASTRAPASATSASGCTSRGSCQPADGGAQPEDDERIEIVPWPLDRLGEAIAECQDAKSLIALLWLAGELARGRCSGLASHRAATVSLSRRREP